MALSGRRRHAASKPGGPGIARVACRRVQNEMCPRPETASTSSSGACSCEQLPSTARAATSFARTAPAEPPDACRNLPVPPWTLVVCSMRPVNTRVCGFNDDEAAPLVLRIWTCPWGKRDHPGSRCPGSPGTFCTSTTHPTPSKTPLLIAHSRQGIVGILGRRIAGSRRSTAALVERHTRGSIGRLRAPCRARWCQRGGLELRILVADAEADRRV